MVSELETQLGRWWLSHLQRHIGRVGTPASQKGETRHSIGWAIATTFTTNFSALQGFLGGSAGKESACNAGDPGSIMGWEDALEKEMATHSSILAWKIPWTEELGGLQSMGSQRV